MTCTMLSRIIYCIGWHLNFFRVEKRHIEEMKDLVASDFSVRIDMPDGYKFEKSAKYLRLFHKRLVEKI